VIFVKINIKILFKGFLLSGVAFSLFYLSSCISPEKIQTPGDLTKDIKIEEGTNIDIPAELKDIDSIKRKLSEKVTIPGNREDKDFVDPFIPKSMKGIELLKNKKQATEVASNNQNIIKKEESNIKEQQNTQQDTQSANVNLATESISMFTYEGVLISSDGRRAILRHIPTNKSYIVSVGTVVGGYKITDIQDNNLILVMGSEKLVIPKNKK
jgi:Tfp pilus assembly protein PilP